MPYRQVQAYFSTFAPVRCIAFISLGIGGLCACTTTHTEQVDTEQVGIAQNSVREATSPAQEAATRQAIPRRQNTSPLQTNQSAQSRAPAPDFAQTSDLVFYYFSTAETTGDVLSKNDDYTNALQPTEIGIKNKDATKTTLSDLQQNYKTGALDWTPDESKALSQIINELREDLTPYQKHLPSAISLGKTSALVEGGLPHTRGNLILFAQSSLDDYFATAASSPDKAIENLKELFLHELHHVLSRHNNTLHDDYFSILGFKPCTFIEPSKLKARRLTNPDAPHYNHYAPLDSEESDGVIPYITVAGPYNAQKGEGLGDYIEFGLLAVNEENGTCTIADSEPGLRPPSDDFFDLIGRNTNYIIHPEETLADNFAHLILERKGLANPEILEEIKNFWAQQQ